MRKARAALAQSSPVASSLVHPGLLQSTTPKTIYPNSLYFVTLLAHKTRQDGCCKLHRILLYAARYLHRLQTIARDDRVRLQGPPRSQPHRSSFSYSWSRRRCDNSRAQGLVSGPRWTREGAKSCCCHATNDQGRKDCRSSGSYCRTP